MTSNFKTILSILNIKVRLMLIHTSNRLHCIRDEQLTM